MKLSALNSCMTNRGLAPVILSLKSAVKEAQLFKLRGTVLESTSLLIRASVPLVSLGEICHITLANKTHFLPAQVVGFRENDVFLMPLGETSGLSPNSQVIPQNHSFSLKVGYPLLGRVLDGLGQPMDKGPDLEKQSGLFNWALHRKAPDPYKRKMVSKPLSLGIKAIDSLLTVGKGQRIGLFAGSGVGKSSLMGQMVRFTEAKVVVVCLVGERGREVMEFINHALGPEGLKKSVVIVATSDTPSLVRYTSCYVATAIAEWFRDQGEDVLFLMDSATRFARAQREIGLALGEPPARQGYPPSVFAEIPRLMERTGANEHGSITAIYNVLVQGSDLEEPIADEVRGILDGHIILSRDLAEKNHWPAIDILPSLSRVMSNIVDDQHKKAASLLRSYLASYEKNKDLILLGAYKPGSDLAVDLAIKKMPAINKFLQQPMGEVNGYQETREQLLRLVT
jgi:type III secretion protein N (ATPase)